MTKKHYEAIADVLDGHRLANDISDMALYSIASDLSDYFTDDNPLFDRARFLQACGIVE